MGLTIEEKLSKIEPRIKESAFLENRGQSGEVGYHIFDYDPKDELKVRKKIARLKHKINSNDNYSFKIQEFDLYEIMMELLEEEEALEMTFDFEKEEGLEYAEEAMIDFFDLDTQDNLIVNYITERIEKGSVVFLTGVGKAYPILRSHNILNNLHLAYDDSPVVLFFPGTYTLNDLCLFNTLEASGYYRASPLIL